MRVLQSLSMDFPIRDMTRRLAVVCATACAVGFLAPLPVPAQLVMIPVRADSGHVYQVLQFAAGADLGTGLDEVRVTSVAALTNGIPAETCATPIDGQLRSPVEAIAYGFVGGYRPIEQAYKSSRIADASPPCFSDSANGGLGRVCIGPGCDHDCACPDDSACAEFSIFDGTAIDTATPDVPAAGVALPLFRQQVRCRLSQGVAYSFAADGSPTTQVGLCGTAPADGFRLAGSPSAFSGGVAGTSVIFAYQAMPDEAFSVGAAGFGIDVDGVNPYGCDAPGRVVAGLEAELRSPVVFPPGPPVDLSREELRCQVAIGRAGRRLVLKSLRAFQFCREKILSGDWEIRSADCALQPTVERALASARRMTRAAIRVCERVDVGNLLACGDTVDELVSPDASSGCLIDLHIRAARDLAVAEYGF